MSSLYTFQSGKVWQLHTEDFFIVTMMHIKNLDLHSGFLLPALQFYPCLELLNKTMMHQKKKKCIWLFNFLFSNFGLFHEKYLVINNKFIVILTTA